MNPNSPRMKAALARCRKAIKASNYKPSNAVVVNLEPLSDEQIKKIKESRTWLHGTDPKRHTNYTGD